MTNEEILIISLLFFFAVAALVLFGIAIRKNDDLREKNKEYISALYQRVDALRNENHALQGRCEAYANENATLASENARLQERSFGVMMRDWQRIEDGERVYYEKDHIRLIIEDDKVVGWYRP